MLIFCSDIHFQFAERRDTFGTCEVWNFPKWAFFEPKESKIHNGRLHLLNISLFWILWLKNCPFRSPFGVYVIIMITIGNESYEKCYEYVMKSWILKPDVNYLIFNLTLYFWIHQARNSAHCPLTVINCILFKVLDKICD